MATDPRFAGREDHNLRLGAQIPRWSARWRRGRQRKWSVLLRRACRRSRTILDVFRARASADRRRRLLESSTQRPNVYAALRGAARLPAGRLGIRSRHRRPLYSLSNLASLRDGCPKDKTTSTQPGRSGCNASNARSATTTRGLVVDLVVDMKPGMIRGPARVRDRGTDRSRALRAMVYLMTREKLPQPRAPPVRSRARRRIDRARRRHTRSRRRGCVRSTMPWPPAVQHARQRARRRRRAMCRALQCHHSRIGDGPASDR